MLLHLGFLQWVLRTKNSWIPQEIISLRNRTKVSFSITKLLVIEKETTRLSTVFSPILLDIGKCLCMMMTYKCRKVLKT